MAPGTSVRYIQTPKDHPTGEPVRVVIYWPNGTTTVVTQE